MPKTQLLLPAPTPRLLIEGRTVEELEAEFKLQREFDKIGELESFFEYMCQFDENLQFT